MSIDFLDPTGSRYIKPHSCTKCSQLQAKVERLEKAFDLLEKAIFHLSQKCAGQDANALGMDIYNFLEARRQ